MGKAPAPEFVPWRSLLWTDGWEGRTSQPVVVEGETPQRYRVRAVDEQLRLPNGRHGVRLILRSGTVLVPKYAVRPRPLEAP